MKRWNIHTVKTALHIYYTAPLQVVFKQFRNGAIYFTVGLMTIFMANTNMEASLAQDIITLCALILGGIGFIIAMLAHMRLIIGRFYQFTLRKKHN